MIATLKPPGIPIRFVLASNGFDDSLCCPVCACPHVHPAEVMVEQGETKTRVCAEQTRVTPTSRSLSHRGSQIGLEFWCESGHAFSYVLSFHKGTTNIQLSAKPAAHPMIRQELWRD